MCRLISAAVLASTSSKSSELFTSSPISASVESTSAEISAPPLSAVAVDCSFIGFMKSVYYSRRRTGSRSAMACPIELRRFSSLAPILQARARRLVPTDASFHSLNLPLVSSSSQGQSAAHQRKAGFCTSPHSPAHNPPQTHWESRIPHSPHAPPRSVAPVCPAALPLANVSVCAAGTVAVDTAASSPYPECLRPRSPFFPRCSSPGPASVAPAPTSASSLRSSTPQ